MGIGGGSGIAGGPIPPQIRESETTAFVEGMKKYVLAMLPADTMEVIPFTQSTYYDTFKYSSSASKPLLAPLLMIRQSAAEEKKESNFQGLFQQFAEMLPDNLKNRFREEGLKNFNERNSDFVALSQLLVATAVVAGWLESVGRPMEAGSAQETLWMQSLILPYLAMNNSIRFGEELSTLLGDQLNSVGHSFTGFDSATATLSQIEKGVEQFTNLTKKWKEGGLTPGEKNKLAQLSDTFAKEAVQAKSLDILSTTLVSMSVIAQAIGKGDLSPTLSLGLSISGGGLFEGSLLQALTPGLTGIANELIGDPYPFVPLASAALSGVAVASSLLFDEGLGFFPGDKKDQETGKHFALDLAVGMAFSSSIVDTLFEKIGRASGAEEKDNDHIKAILKMIALLTALLAALSSNPSKLEEAVEGHSDEIGEGMGVAQETTEGSDAISPEVNVLIQEGMQSLQGGDAKGFINTLGKLGALFDIKEGDFFKDMKQFKGLARLFKESFTTGIDEQASGKTQVSQAM